MRQLNEHHSFTGMQRDMSISKHPTSFLYNAKNIRLTPRGDDTMFAITNERGTKEIGVTIEGTYLGHCLLNEYLVVFTKISSVVDCITRIDLSKADETNVSNALVVLFKGDLEFDTSNPIETLGYYENENIQKVYWTDGENQPRVINIADSRIESRSGSTDYSPFSKDSFDFITKLALNEHILINKQTTGEGVFNAGVIQYAFTYYNKYGQESNIFYTSPLMYISHKDRGGRPDEKVGNSFKIDIYNVDHNFDYLRIYSIQRTSIDATPICKRVCDIKVPSTDQRISYIDTGTQGDSVDPTELLYKGGESIVAKTMAQKDNTLFFGNLKLQRKSVKEILTSLAETAGQSLSTFISNNIGVTSSNSGGNRTVNVESNGNQTYINYNYGNQLNSKASYPSISYGGTTYSGLNRSVPCAGFKHGDVYRCGVQFQHETGVWSEPIFIDDVEELAKPSLTENYNNVVLTLPIFSGSITASLASSLFSRGYKKVRAVVVYPTLQDRNVLCQGVACPTIKHNNQYQSSWFYRPRMNIGSLVPSTVMMTPAAGASNNDQLEYTEDISTYDPRGIRKIEIQGSYSDHNKCTVSTGILTLNTPDIEYDTNLQNYGWTTVDVRKVGEANFITTVSDINIQTETPTISNQAGGFVYSEFLEWYNTYQPQGYAILSQGIITGLFYEDWMVDDLSNGFVKLGAEQSPYKWFVYPWHRTGSLNNDIERPTNMGARSAMLKKKIISNARYANTSWGYDSQNNFTLGADAVPSPVLFNSDETAVIMMGGEAYMGNIDKALYPSEEDGFYYSFDSTDPTKDDITTSISLGGFHWRIHKKGESNGSLEVWRYDEDTSSWGWEEKRDDIGDHYLKVASDKSIVRMKYKSTPHLVFKKGATDILSNTTGTGSSTLPILEFRHTVQSSVRFGGTSEDALKANVWVPCGEPIRLDSTPVDNKVPFEYSYGDTYFQRWDCLKTHAFTQEDINQIVEIGSFQLESHINLDGRYDRNRGMRSNLYMSPQNFNLMNLVYSQLNNFFTYRILDEDYYKLNEYPNQITWSKEKKAGAETDIWANVTLASTYDLDGSKGEITSLNSWKDQIFCFQNKGISTILFNSRVQIPTSDSVPIEISNGHKVDGCRYISDGVGCGNKLNIRETSTGIYFIDNITNHLYHIGEGMQDVTVTHNMSSWFDTNRSSIRRLLYDEAHRDLYLVCDSTSLCFSEVLGQFTSFLDYSGIPLIESYNNRVFTLHNNSLYGMFEGEYNDFFPTTAIVEGQSVTTHNYQPWEFTFISNGSDNSTQDFDKIFSNIDYRMDISKGAVHKPDESLEYIQVVNEYQDTGKVALSRSRVASNYFNPQDANLQKKFRIWRIQIPRNKNSIDRIRNPWCKITLGSNGTGPKKAVLHDLNVQYYI